MDIKAHPGCQMFLAHFRLWGYAFRTRYHRPGYILLKRSGKEEHRDIRLPCDVPEILVDFNIAGSKLSTSSYEDEKEKVYQARMTECRPSLP
jgi:hypothetical protein